MSTSVGILFCFESAAIPSQKLAHKIWLCKWPKQSD